MAALCVAPTASAHLIHRDGIPDPPQGHYAELDAFASRVAHRPVTVRCPTPKEEGLDVILTGFGAWGYVPWIGAEYTVVRTFICSEGLALLHHEPSPSADPWVTALSVLVLTHEAYHLWMIRGDDNEAVTECRAIKRFSRAVVELGGTPEQAHSLLGMAIAIHQYGLAEGYQLRSCRIPMPPLP